MRDYIISVLLAGTERLGDMLIEASTRPDKNRLRRDEIIERLSETLARREVSPLNEDALRTLLRERAVEFHRRVQTAF